jgi:hypothetical protein
MARCCAPAIDTFGVEKILFAVDHPFSDGPQARRFLDYAAISAEEGPGSPTRTPSSFSGYQG